MVLRNLIATNAPHCISVTSKPQKINLSSHLILGPDDLDDDTSTSWVTHTTARYRDHAGKPTTTSPIAVNITAVRSSIRDR
ncbi:uncharacterized protein BP01DRAFT_354927 [Aspergillus saccharolyticus JOP 1030-1]|uniref:Uncharacterized protein n=1 Tax=Aspergillus saccharolyticus JOP 1030-1 TaxID=1450539 RepID=A0A318ZHV5_9EURO|nr:hypothetical protein BP01DRAFT_354927 [Aspergillus saccharolyticus JOP 1030-1]PYH47146.1 hypothetical protein BP01DRAFT_354927 [Aspergillus saccharolyticus JOP 1030-1]